MKGIYCLVISVKKNIKIKVGALGKINFKKGYYVYVGSAQNNIEKRISRHYSKEKKLHWHIDYLLMNKNVKIEDTYYKEAPKKEECRIARFFSEVETPIKNFGSSDCNCKSHLFRLESIEKIYEKLENEKNYNTFR